ncbi:CsbD family protein [Geobacter pelophilus]|uniref:CsbD family protein n=1 Tax=Geoanaerobacter pelophilus TaxID=60036 RepID=A0AAW4L8K8_9BACT|nr:CsbD family protein [Geoanaerobacter pelophilus]MBT0664162.1 CsbD family protein [Geoanaerobacter pelophilus]
MRASRKRMARGMFHEVRGTVKKFVGSLFSNRKLEAKGRVERIAGKLHGKIGKAQAMCGF